MDLAKSLFNHRDRLGYIGKEDHKVSFLIICSIFICSIWYI